MSKKFLALLITLTLLTIGCLDTDFEEPNTQFSLAVELEDEEDTFELGDDEIQLFSIRYAVENVQVEAVGDNELFELDPTYVNLSYLGFNNVASIGTGEIFGGSYTGISFDLIPPSDDVDDELLIVRNEAGEIVQRNSVAIVGQYDSFSFTIVTDEFTNVEYSFDRNVNMPEKLGSLEVVLVPEWQEWFINEDRDGLLDPTDPENEEIILDNFKRLFTANAFTVGEE